MIDHYAEAQRLLRANGRRTQMAALIHAVLAVAQRMEGCNEKCGCEQTSFSWPAVTDLRGEPL